MHFIDNKVKQFKFRECPWLLKQAEVWHVAWHSVQVQSNLVQIISCTLLDLRDLVKGTMWNWNTNGGQDQNLTSSNTSWQIFIGARREKFSS